jgi:hypothetical protein
MNCMRIFKVPFLMVVCRSMALLALLTAPLFPAQLMGQARSSNQPGFVTKVASDSPPLFLPVVNYGSGGSYAYSVAVADVNGDGKPDLVVANGGPGGGEEGGT